MYFLAYYLCQPITLTLNKRKNVHQTLNLGPVFQRIIMCIYIFTYIFKKK